MSYQVFEATQSVDRPLEEVFAFFSKAQNLEKITPPFLSFKMGGMSTSEIQRGTEIWYDLKIHGVPVRWRSCIAEWNPPYAFADIQMQGPYQWWYHQHLFEGRGDTTLMTDRVQYKLPLSFVSQWLMGRSVRKDIQQIFEFRKNTIAEIFK